MKNYEPSLAERQSTAAKARQAQLERVRLMAPANDPKFALRLAERRAAAKAREARLTERRAAKMREMEEEIAQAAARERAIESERAQGRAGPPLRGPQGAQEITARASS
jgi:hypothetical protein